MLSRLFLLFISFYPLQYHATAGEEPLPLIKKYWIQKFNDENGLPQNSVKDMMLDHAGFLWLATENGIVRFDGRNFQVYNSNNTQVSSSRFVTFTKLSGFTPQKFYAISERNEFLEIKAGKVHPDTVSKAEIMHKSLTSIRSKIIWVNNVQNNFWTPPASTVFALPAAEKQNTFYLLRNNSIQYYRNGRLEWQGSHDTRHHGNYFRLHDDLYYVDGEGKLQLRHPSGLFPVKIVGDISKLSPHSKKRIYTNNNMAQVFLYSGHSLYLISPITPGKLQARLLVSGLDLDALNIASLVFDTNRNRLYMGSFTKGLLVVDPTHFTVLDEHVGSSMNNVFYSQAIYDSNSVITPQGSIIGLDPRTGTVRYSESAVFKSVFSADRYSMAKDHMGRFWVKSGTTLSAFDASGQRRLSTIKLGKEITQLKRGMANDLWIGAENALYHKKDGSDSLTFFLPFEGANITSLALEDKNTLWVGTDNGLYRVELAGKQVTKQTSLGNVYVRSLHIPKKEEVWITTYESGFFLLKQNTLTSFPLDRAKSLANSHCIVEDSLGFFWIPTNKYLFQVRKKDLLDYTGNKVDIWYKRYDTSSGFKTNEFNGGCEPCALRLPNGYVSLPSLNGLVWFKPEQVSSELPKGALIVDKILSDSLEIIPHNDSLKLPSAPNHLQLSLSLPYHGPEDEINIRYAFVKDHTLNIPESSWLPITNRPLRVHLFNLKPGQYLLHLRKANGFGLENHTYTTLYISIPAPWYQSWWLYLLVFLFFMTCIYTVVHLNYLYFRKKNEILENSVKERTSELNTLLKDLEFSQQGLIKQSIIKEQIIASISHDIITPLRFLNRLNEMLYKSLVKQKGDIDSLEMCMAGYESGKGLETLITNLLDYVKTDPLDANEVIREPVPLFRLVNSKIDHFDIYLRFKEANITINNLIGRNAIVSSNQHLLGIIILNLLDNSLKASSHNDVVTVSYDHESSTLQFHNRGHAMSENILKWINNPALPGLESEKRIGVQPHRGIGLMIVKQVALLLDITLTATSDSQNGTSFYVRLNSE